MTLCLFASTTFSPGQPHPPTLTFVSQIIFVLASVIPGTLRLRTKTRAVFAAEGAGRAGREG